MSTPLCVIFQICVPSVADAMGVTFTSPFGRLVVSMSSVCGNTYGCRFAFVRPGGRDGRDPEERLHPPELVEGRRVHLVVNGLRLEVDRQLRSSERVEGERLATLLTDADEPVALDGRARRRAVSVRCEARAVGRVVGSLPDDDRVLDLLEYARAVRLVAEGRLQGLEGERLARPTADLHLHDRAGVRPVPGQGARRAGRPQVGAARVVVVAGDPGGNAAGASL